MAESLYQPSLARVHDDGFLKYSENAAQVVIEFLRSRDADGQHHLDLGCGTGRLAELVAASGSSVTGIDISPDMLAIARERHAGVEWREGSIWEAVLPGCSSVSAVGEILNYRAAASFTPANTLALIEKVFQVLEPGGLFLFDFATAGRLGGPSDKTQFFETDEWQLVVESTENGNLLTRRCIMFLPDVSDGNTWTRQEETHFLELLDPKTIMEQLQSTGFHITQGRSYGNAELPHGMVQIHAVKE